jgi:hypothetical protein
LPDSPKYWLEVWISYCDDPPYVLIVRNDLREPNRIQVCDPQCGGTAVYESYDYEDVSVYLCEDEFIRADRRMIRDSEGCATGESTGHARGSGPSEEPGFPLPR